MSYQKPKAVKLSVSVTGEQNQWLEANLRGRSKSKLVQDCIDTAMAGGSSVSPLDDNAYTQLVLDFCGGLFIKAQKLAAEQKLPQTEFLSHILQQSIGALQSTHPEDSWEEIKVIPPHLEVYEKNFEAAAEDPPKQKTPTKQDEDNAEKPNGAENAS